MNWTLSQIEALAPDAKSLKRGQGLANQRKWENLAQHAIAIWGECQGSGQKPYYTRIDLTEPAYKCSCPSRQFPCKHALALLLLYAQSPKVFASIDPPEWVADWLAQRRARQKKAQTAAASSGPDLEAQATRARQRLANIQQGLAGLKIWLMDAMRLGLAELSQQDHAYWEAQAARMVDAQASGVANLIRSLQSHFLRKNWQEEALDQIGLLYMLVQSFERWETWDQDFQTTLLGFVGVNVKKDTLAAQTGIHDQWQVLGRLQESEDELDILRTWIWGKSSRRFALLLDFAYGGRGFQQSFLPGTAFEGEIVFYPGTAELRAHVKLPVTVTAQAIASMKGASLPDMLTDYALLLGQNPLTFRYPVLLTGLIPYHQGSSFVLLTQDQQLVPLAPSFQQDWELVSLSGGQPLSLFGEWNGKTFLPLGVKHEGRWVGL